MAKINKTKNFKSVSFLYTGDEQSKKQVKQKIPFTMASKRIKYLAINLTREVKVLYKENYKTLLKEIKDDLKKKEKQSIFMGRKTMLAIFPSMIYRFNPIPIKTLASLFVETDKLPIKFIRKFKGLTKAKTILENNNKVEGFILPEFKTYYRATENKTV